MMGLGEVGPCQFYRLLHKFIRFPAAFCRGLGPFDSDIASPPSGEAISRSSKRLRQTTLALRVSTCIRPSAQRERRTCNTWSGRRCDEEEGCIMEMFKPLIGRMESLCL